MKSILFVILWVVGCAGNSLAGGSIGWEHVKAMIAKTDPELVKMIERDFEVNASGGGVRLGPQFGERHGERISPFRFGVLNRKTKERCVLVIEESDDYEFTGRYKFLKEPAENSSQAEQAVAARPVVYYANNEELKDRVRLSDEMAAKVVEILNGKPKPFDRGTLLAAPRGYFSVDGKTYPYFGFLTTHPQKGDSWDDPALRRFWAELNKVESKAGLDPLKDFKP